MQHTSRLEYLIERAAQLGKVPDQILTLKEAAEYVGVEKQWIYSRRRKIGFIQEGKVLRIRKSALDAKTKGIIPLCNEFTFIVSPFL